jgi:hypothetical protein
LSPRLNARQIKKFGIKIAAAAGCGYSHCAIDSEASRSRADQRAAACAPIGRRMNAGTLAHAHADAGADALIQSRFGRALIDH